MKPVIILGIISTLSLKQILCQNTPEHRSSFDGIVIEDVDPIGSLRPIRQSPATKAKPKDSPPSLSLQELILVLMAKHGEGRTSAAFNSLDSKELGEVMRILLVQVDKEFASDIVEMQSYAQNSDKMLVAVIARIVTGDSTVAKDIFVWDDKLRKFPWWLRIRKRIFLNLDKYISDFDPTTTTTPSPPPSTEVKT